MSDFEDSSITYTDISSPFEHLSDMGYPGVDGLPMVPQDLYVQAVLQALPSPDYVPGPEHPPLPIYVPEFVPELVYPKFIPAEDDILPAEEQPLPVAASPTTDSPGDKGDDEDESSDDDDVDIEGDVEEGDHLAPGDSIAVDSPAVDHALFAEETEPFEIDESAATPPPHPVYRVTARMSIRPQTSISLPLDTEIAKLMAIPTPPPSPLSPLSLPIPPILSPLPKILSPPLPPSLPLPTSPTYPLGYRDMMIRLKDEAPSTLHSLLLPSTYHLTPPSGTPSLLPILLPTLSPPLLSPSTDPKMDIMRNLERDVGYGNIDSWDEIVETMQGAPATDEIELGRRVTDLVETMRRDIDEISTRLDNVQSERQLMASRLNLLGKDRTLCIQVVAQRLEIMELRAADRRRQAQFIEALRLLMRLQTQMIKFKRQQGPAKGLAQPDALEEAGSNS
nr:hypothetical protein [Tanacetum cinerariifolium]